MHRYLESLLPPVLILILRFYPQPVCAFRQSSRHLVAESVPFPAEYQELVSQERFEGPDTRAFFLYGNPYRGIRVPGGRYCGHHPGRYRIYCHEVITHGPDPGKGIAVYEGGLQARLRLGARQGLGFYLVYEYQLLPQLKR